MKTIITGLLSKAYNYDNGKIAELFKDGEELSEEKQTEILNSILEADRVRVENIKKTVETKEVFQDGYKKAQSEVLTAFEKGLKEKFGIESSKMGVDLVEEIVTSKSSSGKGGNLDEDAIKRSKIYQDLENAKKVETEALKTDYEKKIEEINNGYQYEKTFSDVQKQALQIFNGMEPVLPTIKSVADNQVNNFISSLKSFKFDKQGDRIVVMDAEGKVVEDGHGNSKSFEDIVKENASGLFEFRKNNGGSGSGNREPEGGNGGKYSGAIPKSVDELEKVLQDKTISASDRADIAVEFEKAQKGI